MNRVTTILVPLVTAVLGGAVGGLLTGHSAASQAKAVQSADADPADPGSDSSLKDRVSALESQVARLKREKNAIAALRAYGSAIAARRGAPDAGAPPSSPVDDPVFQAAVEDIIDRTRQERRQEQMQRFTQRVSDRLTSQLKLDPDQQQKVAQAIQDYMKQIRDMWENRDADGGLDRNARRQRMQALRKDARTKIAGTLRSDQLDKFQSMDRVLPFGGRGRRGGGSNRGGGNGAQQQ